MQGFDTARITVRPNYKVHRELEQHINELNAAMQGMNCKSIKIKRSKSENIVDSTGREIWLHQTFTSVHCTYTMSSLPWVTAEVLKLHSDGITWKSPPRLGAATVSGTHRSITSATCLLSTNPTVTSHPGSGRDDLQTASGFWWFLRFLSKKIRGHWNQAPTAGLENQKEPQ